MSGLAVLLVLASALAHVAWNLVGKASRPTAAFFLVANLTGAACGAPLLLAHPETVAAVPPAVWGLLGVTGVFQAAYCVALAGAYRTADFSMVYPLARSLPALTVLLASTALGRGDRLSALVVAGCCVIVLGGLLLPLRSFRALRPASYRSAGFAWALFATAATTGYSLIDDAALHRLREVRPVLPATLVYIALDAAATAAAMSLFVAFAPRQRANLGALRGAGLRRAAGTGVAIYATYGLALGALAFVDDVTYVVAFRQIGIPIGALLGVLLLRERMSGPRLAGVGAAFVGPLLVAIG